MRWQLRGEALVGGRVVRMRLVGRWMVAALTFAGTLWVALGPVRVTVHTRRAYWSEP